MSQDLKLSARILENLPEMSSEEKQNWIEDPKGLAKVLKEALTKAVVEQTLKVWKTVKLGTGIKNADGFKKAIAELGYKIGDWANDIMGKKAFKVSNKPMELDLVKMTVAELGFKDGAKLVDIYTKIKSLGGTLCPPEVGPQLRLQYTDQPKGDWFLIAMETIVDSGGNPDVCKLERSDDGEVWLYANYDDPSLAWRSGCPFVFVLPRKK